MLSGAIEIACLYSYLYGKKHLMAFGWQDIKAVIDWPKISRFLRLSLPTTFNFSDLGLPVYLPTTLSWGRRGFRACCAIRHDSG
ncbi:multidrug efflux pump VcmH [Vibrio cholerae NCTC 8457]|nr:multidrug efflux pump VcmH [Vibrio cholerae NCTC 8457]